MFMGLAELLVFMMPLALVGFIVWMALGRRRDRYAKMAAVQKEIIGKFSSSAEMQAFLRSDEGRDLFRNLAAGGPEPRTLRERAISRIGIGIVLVVVGTGLGVLAHDSDQPQMLMSVVPQPAPPGAGTATPVPLSPPSGPILEVPPGTGLPAAALFLTGVGLIISALVTLRLTSGERSKS